MAWLHSNGVFMDVNAEVKETIFPGAACLLRTIFEDYEEYESEAEFSIELINDISRAQRAIFAGETFLLLFDPSFCIPQRALHEAFATEFLLHTLSHIATEVREEKTELRIRMFKVLSQISPYEHSTTWLLAKRRLGSVARMLCRCSLPISGRTSLRISRCSQQT